MDRLGFIGLGNMGSALAANLVDAGHDLVVHDALGAARAPRGTSYAESASDVARAAAVVFLSLPDGAASTAVTDEIAATDDRRVTHVIDTSTIGVTAARRIAARLTEAAIVYVDAPVSGGVTGARARTLAVMYAAPDDACSHVDSVLAGLSERRYRVGDRAGLGQAMKLANNFLSATALAATSEAIAFGRSLGLDMETMLETLNASSGRNTATSDKFPTHVVTERYASGFAAALMAKDVALYLEAVHDAGSPATIGAVTADLWAGFASAQPTADFTRIFPFVERAG